MTELDTLLRSLPPFLRPTRPLSARKVAELADYRIRWLTQFRSPHRWITVEQMPALRDLYIRILHAAWAEEDREHYSRRAVEQAEALERWKQGERIYTWNISSCPVALRVIGDTVETSRGATIPLSHAVRGLRFIRSVIASGQPYKRNGHTFHLGHYAIDEIDAQGNLKAECHDIAYSEIERIAPLLESAQPEVTECA